MSKLNPLELIGCGAIIVDHSEKIVSWNEASTKILGLKKSQALNRDISEIINTQDDINRKSKLLQDIRSTITAGEPNPPFNDIYKWRGKWVGIELDGFVGTAGNHMCLITVMDISKYQEEIIRLSEENTKLTKDLKKSTISDAWIRKTVLKGLFSCVFLFVTLALVIDSLFNINNQYIYSVITSFTSMLSVAIGYYFNNDQRQGRGEGNIEGFFPYETTKVEGDIHLEPIEDYTTEQTEDNILGIK